MEVSTEISLQSGDAAQRERAKSNLYVLLQAAGWGAFLTVEIWTTIAFPDHEMHWDLVTTLAATVMLVAACLLLTHVLRPVMGAWRWKELGWRKLLPRIFLMSMAAALVLNVFECVWIHGIIGLPWNVKFSVPMVLLLEEFYNSILFFGWLALYFLYHLFDRLNRSEIERFQLMSSVKEAELRALKSQVNPHFIFNSLNSLRALIEEDPARARTAVTQLANLLRYSLQSGQTETVPFEDELEVVNDYLALEQVRHEERLRLRLDIAPETLRLPIPPMLLQTLVENAVKYGISTRTEGGEIAIIARNEGGELRIQVTNPGTVAPPRGQSTGVGLHNAAERLRLIFGDGATLQLRPRSACEVVAEAIIPLPAHP